MTIQPYDPNARALVNPEELVKDPAQLVQVLGTLFDQNRELAEKLALMETANGLRQQKIECLTRQFGHQLSLIQQDNASLTEQVETWATKTTEAHLEINRLREELKNKETDAAREKIKAEIEKIEKKIKLLDNKIMSWETTSSIDGGYLGMIAGNALGPIGIAGGFGAGFFLGRAYGDYRIKNARKEMEPMEQALLEQQKKLDLL